ncbi:MAG: hypothetical protein KDJ73_08865 [Notoacmeibacter sp.]|nr:hypothetical protein [Notoacmeibacter sp.]MCC0031732.1 hypothetical protein [Brucellaceae bacterium]
MRWLLVFWALPLLAFGGWYYLSYYDMNFGTIYLSRALHDAVFQLYGDILGVAPEVIPGMLLKAIMFDTVLILAIFAFRRRAAIRAWWLALQPPAPRLAERDTVLPGYRAE